MFVPIFQSTSVNSYLFNSVLASLYLFILPGFPFPILVISIDMSVFQALLVGDSRTHQLHLYREVRHHPQRVSCI